MKPRSKYSLLNQLNELQNMASIMNETYRAKAFRHAYLEVLKVKNLNKRDLMNLDVGTRMKEKFNEFMSSGEISEIKTKKEINAKTFNKNSVFKMKSSSDENSQEIMIWLTRLLYFFHSTCSSLSSFSKTIQYVWMLKNYNLKNLKSKNVKNDSPKKKKLLSQSWNSEKNSIFNFCVLSCIQKKSRQIWEMNPNFKKNKSFVELYKKDENIEMHKTLSFPQGSSNPQTKLPIQMFKFYIGWVGLKNILSKFIKIELNKDIDASKLTLEQVQEMIAKKTPEKKTAAKKTATKKTTAKKTPAKKK